MTTEALNIASSQLISQSTEKLNQSATKVANGNINPAEISKVNVEAVREAELGVKLAQISDQISEEVIELVTDTHERKGRVTDHFN
jgi:hypothetical protein